MSPLKTMAIRTLKLCDGMKTLPSSSAFIGLLCEAEVTMLAAAIVGDAALMKEGLACNVTAIRSFAVRAMWRESTSITRETSQ